MHVLKNGRFHCFGRMRFLLVIVASCLAVMCHFVALPLWSHLRGAFGCCSRAFAVGPGFQQFSVFVPRRCCLGMMSRCVVPAGAACVSDAAKAPGTVARRLRSIFAGRVTREYVWQTPCEKGDDGKPAAGCITVRLGPIGERGGAPKGVRATRTKSAKSSVAPKGVRARRAKSAKSSVPEEDWMNKFDKCMARQRLIPMGAPYRDAVIKRAKADVAARFGRR